MDAERIDVAGIPGFRADPGQVATAGIVFRVGHADETLANHGITHLIEHLAIHACGKRDHMVNGYVDATRCAFYATGTTDEIWSYLTAVTAQLADLPTDRLEAERRVLRAEIGPASVGERLLAHRYGAAGPGLSAMVERGLDWLGPDELRRWAAEHFTAQNAAFWVRGDVPDGLPDGFGLPAGSARPDPVLEPLVSAFPAYVAEGSGGVALAMVGRRSTPLVAATQILAERLHESIRLDAGLGYAPYGDYLRLDGTLAHVLAGSDCADHHAEQVLRTLRERAAQLAEEGATDAELDRHRRQARENLEAGEAAGAPGFVLSHAEDLIAGAEPLSRSAVLDQIEALDGAAVGEALREALDTAILLGVDGLPAPAGHAETRTEPAEITAGATFEGRGWRRSARPVLVIGEEGITYTNQGSSVTIPAAWLETASSAPDGSVTLAARDGAWLRLDPAGFRDPAAVSAALREHLGDRPMLPIADAHQTAEVERIARRDGITDKGTLSAALRALPGLLHDDETLRVLVDGSRKLDKGGAAAGLLAVTDRRLIWNDDDSGEVVEELLLRAVSDIDMRRTRDLSQRLLVVTPENGPAWRLTFSSAEGAHIIGMIRDADPG